MIYTLENENAPKYNKGQKVKTEYGKGKIIEIGAIYKSEDKVYYTYRIKYSLFKKLWCLEDTILEEIKWK